jgi:hypothetical protein
MHIPVRVWKNGKYTDLRLYNTSQNQEFVISDTKIDRVEFDPDKWLIAKADIVNTVVDVSENRIIQIVFERESKNIRILLPDNSKKGKLRIVDMTGRVVKNFDLSESDSRIAISDLKAGIYLVEVQVGTLMKSEKILLSPFQAE